MKLNELKAVRDYLKGLIYKRARRVADNVVELLFDKAIVYILI